MNKTIYIPLDNRPCTYQFPAKLAAISGHQMVLPPRENMGTAKKACKLKQLDSWLGKHLSSTQRLIVSLDTWIYGGLVSSRITAAPFEQLQIRLVQLKQLKADYPEVSVHAFITLLRISNSNDSTEEREYWATYGQQLYRLSYLDDYLASGHYQEDFIQEWGELKQAIPESVLKDYKQLRLRNLQMIKLALQLVKENTLDSLVIGYDDGGEYGWNVQERKELEQMLKSEDLEHRVLIYPGADEIGSTLSMRALIPHTFKIYPTYSYPNHRRVHTKYEGIPLEDTVNFQLRAAGCQLVNHWKSADAILWIHNPEEQQYDQFLQRDQVFEQDNQQLLEEMTSLLALGKKVALADVRYANGGDYGLLKALMKSGQFLKLQGYSAWNTTGNTLGMAFAWLQASLSGLPQTRLTHLKFLLERYLDDGLYQGFLRQKLSQHYSDAVTMEHALTAMDYFQKTLNDWQPQLMEQGVKEAVIETFQFSWSRFFEAEIDVKLKVNEPE